MTISIIALIASIGALILSISISMMGVDIVDEIIEILYPPELSCETCKWHNTECGNSDPYEGKSGYIAGDDWCELYVREGEK